MYRDVSFNGSGSHNASFQYSYDISLTALNNDTSSIVNNGATGALSTAWFYADGNYSGDYRRLWAPGQGKQSRDPSLINGTDANTAYFNDVISSATFR